jgi:dTDP-4-amino-4,6-dideoxygalactose transaminase
MTELSPTLSKLSELASRKPREDFLLFSPPNIGEEEITEVVETLRSSWITTGPKTRRFESSFAAYLGAEGALALNSCTAGLHVALAAWGIGAGDEVITTDMTFAASVNVIEHVGARPVLVDVEPDTLNIDPVQVEKAISPRTKVILPVHYAGHPVELDAINSIAIKHDLRVLEDAAHALPARYKGRLVGAGTSTVAFSFYATKNLTTAEGGMLTGNLPDLDRARMLSLHGMSRDAWKRYDKGQGRSWFYEVNAPGYKYNMTDIAASLGLHQLERLEQFQARRKAIAQRYSEVFQTLDTFEPPTERAHVTHAWHLYVLRLNLETLRINRDAFIEAMTEREIGTSVHFIPIHLHPYYRDKYQYASTDFPVAMRAYECMVSLPLHPGMSDSDVEDVISAVLDIALTYRR